MNAADVSIAPRFKTLRCPDCGTKDEYPARLTQKDVPNGCDVCQFHFRHELVSDPDCPICVAHRWQARLRALRILLFYRAWVNGENVR